MTSQVGCRVHQHLDSRLTIDGHVKDVGNIDCPRPSRDALGGQLQFVLCVFVACLFLFCFFGFLGGFFFRLGGVRAGVCEHACEVGDQTIRWVALSFLGESTRLPLCSALHFLHNKNK